MMDEEQKIPETINDNPQPNVIRPSDPYPGASNTFSDINQPQQPVSPPAPGTLTSPAAPPAQPQAPASLPTDPGSGAFPPPPPPPQPSVTPPVPVQTPQSFQPDGQPGMNIPPMPGSQPPRGIRNLFRNKKLVLLLGAQLLVILLVVGGVFGYYLPNRPQNVWNAGLDRTGKAMDELINQSTQKDKLDKLKKSELDGSLEVTGQGVNFKGTFSTKYDPHNSDNAVDVKYKGADNQEKALSAKLLAALPEGADLPDIYFQISGFNAFGGDLLYPGLSGYDGKWISVSSQYLKSVLTPEEQQALKKSQKSGTGFDSADAAEIARIVSATTREYVLTSDTTKSILVQKKFIATEKVDHNITANHYLVGINNANLQNYCEALVNRVMASGAYKKLPWVNADTLDKDKAAQVKECKNSENDVKASYSFDLWIDKRTKLIHELRFEDEKTKGNYVEVGQNYTGGDTLPLFVIYHSDKEKYNMEFDLDINTKQNDAKGTLDMKYSGDQGYNIKASLEFKPYDGQLNVTKPDGAIPIEEVFKKLGIDPSSGL